MKLNKKINLCIMRTFALLMVMCITLTMGACGVEEDNNDISLATTQQPVTITIWYTGNNMTDYLSEIADNFSEENSNITVNTMQVTKTQYMSKLYDASIHDEENMPDVYICSSDDLQEAYLLGIAEKNDEYASEYTVENFGKAAIEAATYDGKLYGYPLTFDTSVMVYNKTFAKEMKTFTEITDYTNNFEYSEEMGNVTRIINWDISDGFLNYAFTGASMNICGSTGEDIKKVSINNENVIRDLNEWLSFKENYGIDRSKVTKSSCITDFVNGSLLYTIVNASDISALEASDIEYSITKIPDYNSELKTTALSETTLAVVNPFSKNVEASKKLARAITIGESDKLAEYTGFVPAYKKADSNENYSKLRQIFADTTVKCQLMNIGDVYMQYEIMMHRIWDGDDITGSVDAFNTYVAVQFAE